jgi:hypothetical protein
MILLEFSVWIFTAILPQIEVKPPFPCLHTVKKPPLDIHHNQRIHPITSLGVCHNSDNSCIFAHSFVEFNSSFIEKPRFSAGNEVFLISFKNVFVFF